MTAAGNTPVINGGFVDHLAHGAIDEAYSRRIADLWLTLLRDAQHNRNQVSEQAVARFNTGYRLAIKARAKAHELIDQFQQEER